MTFICNAPLAERLAASRTAFSAQSTLRPRNSARLRINATASFVAFAVMASFNAGCCVLPQIDVEMDLDLGAPGPAHGFRQPFVAGAALIGNCKTLHDP